MPNPKPAPKGMREMAISPSDRLGLAPRLRMGADALWDLHPSRLAPSASHTFSENAYRRLVLTARPRTPGARQKTR